MALQLNQKLIEELKNVVSSKPAISQVEGSSYTGKDTLSQYNGMGGGTGGGESGTSGGKASVVDSYNKMISDLTEIDDKYSSSYVQPVLDLPETLGTQFIEYDQPTIGQVQAQAKEELLPSYIEDKAEIEADAKSKSDTVKNSITSAENTKVQKIKNLASQLESKIEQVKNTAVTNGVARGSIMDSAVTSATDDFNAQADSVSTQTANEQAVLQDKLNQIEEQAELLLAALEDTHDAELKARVTKILQEVAEKREEITKYNNTLSEKEAKFVLDAKVEYEKAKQNELKRVVDVLELSEELGADYVKAQAEFEKFQIAKKYFDTLDPSVAWNVFSTNGGLSSVLGDYYTTLYAYLKDKAGK